MISCIVTTNFIYFAASCHRQQPKPEPNSQDKQPYKANANSHILRTGLFPGMINLHNRENSLGLPSDEFIIYLSANMFLKQSYRLLFLFCWQSSKIIQITSRFLVVFSSKFVFLLGRFTLVDLIELATDTIFKIIFASIYKAYAILYILGDQLACLRLNLLVLPSTGLTRHMCRFQFFLKQSC